MLEQAPLPPQPTTTSLSSTEDKSLVAMDIGVRTGVLTAWLWQQYATANQATATTMRGERQWQFSTVIGTDNNPAAIACAQENLQHMGLSVAISMTTSTTHDHQQHGMFTPKVFGPGPTLPNTTITEKYP